MESSKNNIEAFFSNLRKLFPKLDRLKLWTEYDWKTENFETYIVMNDLGEEMVRWNESNDFAQIVSLLNYIERSLTTYDSYVTSCIYTDFFTVIIACENKELREKIKANLGAESKIEYDRLLSIYEEPN